LWSQNFKINWNAPEKTHFPNGLQQKKWKDCNVGTDFCSSVVIYKYFHMFGLNAQEWVCPCVCVCCVYKLIICCEESRARGAVRPSALPTTNRFANLLFDSGEVLLGLLIGRNPRRKHVPETRNHQSVSYQMSMFVRLRIREKKRKSGQLLTFYWSAVSHKALLIMWVSDI
jgi:hypothetical protein